MILTCPSCSTQYVVKDGAIPPGGRQVRCASCKHSWHQDPDAAADSDEAQDEDESLAEATLIDPRSGPEAEERAYEEAMVEDDPAGAAPAPLGDRTAVAEQAEDAPSATYVASQFDIEKKREVEPEAAPATADWDGPRQAEAQDEDFTPFPAAEEIEPRRRSPIITILVVALVVAAIAAAFWFLAPPEWRARIGLGGGGASPLALVTTHMDRQRLESGNELLTVTGRVINPTTAEQDVPPLRAQLRTRAGQVVYRWTIAPPARSLPPGASASFNSAEVNVPPGGEELTITLGSPRA